MKRNDVKIGSYVVMTATYCGTLKKGDVFKVLKPQVKTDLSDDACFVVDHMGKKSYLAPYCSNFEPQSIVTNSENEQTIESLKHTVTNLKDENDQLRFSNNEFMNDIRIQKIIIDKKSSRIETLNLKDEIWTKMYNDLMARHEALKAKWWYKLFTKLESWIKEN